MSDGTNEPLADLFRHNVWANLIILDVCDTLTDAQLNATVQGTYGSISATLLHMAGAEESYLARLTGEQFTDAIRARPEEVLGLTDFRAHLRRSGEALIDVARRVGTIDRIRVAWDGKVWQVPPGIILTQAINHATEHRAHIMTILTQQGIEPPEIDGWAYIVANIPTEGEAE